MLLKADPNSAQDGQPDCRGCLPLGRRYSGPVFLFSKGASPFLPDCGRNTAVGRQQPFARQHQIREAKQGKELLGVLVQAPVTGLLVVEQVLHHVEGMLHLGTDAGLQLLDPLEQLTQGRASQRFALAPFHGHMPSDGNLLVLFTLLHPLVTRIGVDLGLLPTEQRLGLGDIVDVGGRAHHGVHQSRFGIHADVRLHAEMPLVAFLGLVHLARLRHFRPDFPGIRCRVPEGTMG